MARSIYRALVDADAKNVRSGDKRVMADQLRQTVLHDLHLSNGGKMVPFAGYSMPVQYKAGVLKEHLHARTEAGLFDVSHMGQIILEGRNYEEVANALETLIPMSVTGLARGRQRYGFFTNDQGGILDDIMFSHLDEHLFLVVNAACVEHDLKHLTDHLGSDIKIKRLEDRALLALQGPQAEAALASLNPVVKEMRFMDVKKIELCGAECWVSRSGYTGEDGYEISVPNDTAHELATALLTRDEVELIGLGARDSLRLEAGLCLYGNDIDTKTTPIQANLTWAIQKSRRNGGASSGGFPGADIILEQISNGPKSVRVALRPTGRAPVRGEALLFAKVEDTQSIGHVTSGGFGPSVNAPVSMGYLKSDYARPNTVVYAEVRGKRHEVIVTVFPFIPARFKR